MSWNPQAIDPDWPYDLMATSFEIDRNAIALLIIDMQAKDMRIEADSEMARRHPHVAAYWNDRIEGIVIPNIRALIDTFRAGTRKIIYTRNGHTTSTGHQVTARLKRKRLSCTEPAYDRSSPGYDVEPRLAPRAEDLVVDKLTSGAFTASFLDHALRNMGIRTLIITGVLTDMCVLGTARAASELGYDTLICENACATCTQRAHTEALLVHARGFGRVTTTQQAMDELNKK